ncbi:MAG: hypothetical protein IPG50_11535 [Myxococcales bacterium]|nr:hypothetical protein [Myxococcales bacterium]
MLQSARCRRGRGFAAAKGRRNVGRLEEKPTGRELGDGRACRRRPGGGRAGRRRGGELGKEQRQALVVRVAARARRDEGERYARDGAKKAGARGGLVPGYEREGRAELRPRRGLTRDERGGLHEHPRRREGPSGPFVEARQISARSCSDRPRAKARRGAGGSPRALQARWGEARGLELGERARERDVPPGHIGEERRLEVAEAERPLVKEREEARGAVRFFAGREVDAFTLKELKGERLGAREAGADEGAWPRGGDDAS